MISATGWLRPTIGTRSPSPNPKSFKLRASFIEYPLASKIMVRIKLVKDETTKKSKGYAFIQYTNQDDAMNALETMDEKYVDGRVLFVELAKPVKDRHSAYPKTSGPPQPQPQRPVSAE
ncbi:organelle RRM domain-containing protein 6, chloroplastic isoform X2 [Cynara cardunculus var. scolymus]|uniref:organelle RRM domain-containing protein 6, chloroplastic isoform X2 n=1 Tax=Cynara cardunculus var. scolymus TaxID=59895 RepID=UPI000D62E290|nr:organelle RRM domain-containing protein 6, chloroplastic isoform X2 [Cynara cardunculus var. scolymus]